MQIINLDTHMCEEASVRTDALWCFFTGCTYLCINLQFIVDSVDIDLYAVDYKLK